MAFLCLPMKLLMNIVVSTETNSFESLDLTVSERNFILIVKSLIPTQLKFNTVLMTTIDWIEAAITTAITSIINFQILFSGSSQKMKTEISSYKIDVECNKLCGGVYFVMTVFYSVSFRVVNFCSCLRVTLSVLIQCLILAHLSVWDRRCINTSSHTFTHVTNKPIACTLIRPKLSLHLMELTKMFY